MADIAVALEIDAAAARKRLGEVYRKFNILGRGPGKLARLLQVLMSQYQQQYSSQLQAEPAKAPKDLSRSVSAPKSTKQTAKWADTPEMVFESLAGVDAFYGRSRELDQLEAWIVKERCRLVEVLGSGGIGKTSLVAELVKRVKDQFEQVVWCSLSHTPPPNEILAELLQKLGDGQVDRLSENLDDRMVQLLGYLQRHRCLLILDGIEHTLRRDALAGTYQEGYQDYGTLLRLVAKTEHQSCLVATSSEKTQEFTELEGRKVRAFHLQGLTAVEARDFFKERGLFAESDQAWSTINQLYGGNPLALKIASVTIQEVFGGSLTEFLNQGTAVFGDISNLLRQQFERLSRLERHIMYWLALSAEPTSLTELRNDMVPPVAQPRLLEALESLSRRSLVERDKALFSLQPVVMEYVANRLVERVYEEISSGKIKLLNSHALIKAEAKDYIRERQIGLILKPLIERLATNFANEVAVQQRLLQLVAEQQQAPLKPGYMAGNLLNLMGQMRLDLSDCNFSRLTVRQAYLKDIELHRVNFTRADLAQSVFAEKLGSILSLAFSPDGKRLATGDTDNQIRIWNLVTGEQIATWQGHEDWVRSVAFSPDGQTLASGSEDKTIRLWNVATGQCNRILENHTSWVRSVAFSPDGQLLASGSDDHTVRIWQVATGECIHKLTEHTNVVRSVAFSPNGKLLASGSSDHTICLWDVGQGECIRVLKQHLRGVRSVAFSPDGQTLASGSSDHTICLWTLETGECWRTLKGHRGWVWSVVFSPNGQFLASGSEDQTVRLWQVETGELLKTLHGHTSWVRSVKFSPDGQLLASGSDDQTVKLWDVKNGQRLKTLQGYARGIRSVAFSPDGQTLASGSEDQTVRIWNMATEQCLIELSEHKSRVWSVAFSPDGRLLASGSEDCTIRLWHMGAGECLKIFSGHGDGVHSVAFSPDGQILASGSSDRTVRLWQVMTGQCLAILSGHTDWVWSVTFSPDGNTLASGSSDLTVKLWDVRTYQCLNTLKGHTHWIRSVAFSPDGKTLASSSVGRMVRLWDVKSGKNLSTLDGFKNGIRSVAFSPDSRILASGSDDRVVRLWDVKSGQCLQALEGHADRVRSVAFSLDGKLLASGSNDEAIKLWQVETGKELKTLRLPRLYEGMNITGALNLSPTQRSTLIALGAIDEYLTCC
ncbi:MAG: NB-ARC domain-containing protein [Leptolyngbya sp. IPPAS B-1204]|nr:NACHT domain-containing protein [Elainella sp. C42_A2020_010]RNJ66919.1 MAG: NACHT domain-containing protein [Leptolyngbya sp. IPPAS B-1204]